MIKKEKKISYLHLTASNKNSDILKCLLLNKSIDVNAVDSNDETPLMIACKNKIEKNIKLFFTRDDLDYLYSNKEGKDALMLIQNNRKNKIDSFENKDEYLKQLIACIHGNSSMPCLNLKLQKISLTKLQES